MRHDPRSIKHVRRALLAMLGRAQEQGEPGGKPLTEAEWAILADMARQHRLEPLLHGRSAVWQAPEECSVAWAQAYRRSAIDALAAKGTLIRAARILGAAGIAYAALKGAWLAWHAYPHPALRPMRDIDILVAPGRLEEAYRALVANGFVELAGGPFSADTLALGRKHLPALRDVTTGTYVEVHSRLFEHVEPATAGAFLCQSESLLASRVWLPLEQERIAYLPPCETLLHLLVHSAYEHRFDNGPQVLHDVAEILAREAIDWQRFWMLAGEGGWSRGCHLVLRLTEDLLGPQPIVWDAAEPGRDCPKSLPDGILETAALMLLQDPELRRDLDVQLQLGSLADGSWSSLRRLLARFVPRRRVIATYAGVSPDGHSVWLHYPGWLATRLVRTARGVFDRRQRSEVARANAIESWLAAD